MELSDINIIRSNRRTVSLEVEEDGRVILRAPERASMRALGSFLKQKETWLDRAVAAQKKKFAVRPVRTFEPGEPLLYLGTWYPLVYRVSESRRRPVELVDAFYLDEQVKPIAVRTIERWYKHRAKIIFQDRAAWFAPQMQADFTTVRLSSAETRWGSCGRENSLNVNWRLVMAPLPVIDSVIIHELAHCRHKNHGKRFWQYVQKHCPDYKNHDTWLRTNAHHLHW